MIGSSNRFAHAAAVAVAEAPGKAYNPLLIYGDSGLGKTHLLHAIGHYVRSLFTGARVRYVSSRGVHQRVHQRDPRRPTGPVPAALPRRRRPADRRHPVPGGQDPDAGGVLPHLQHPAQRQQADRDHLRPAAQAPRGARGPAPQPVRVGPDHRRPAARPRDPDRDPAQEGRHRAADRARRRCWSSSPRKIQTNIRELEGALIRVTAFASLNRQPVDLTLAEIVLKDLIPEGGEPEITAAADHGPDRGLLRSLDRRPVRPQPRAACWSPARQIAMYLCRELTDLSLPKIGQQFGGRDHTTVMHADKQDPRG